MNFTPKWFYIFESPTGLLYLGQTIPKTPGLNYFGSGSYWLNHIKAYGKPILLFSRWCETSQEFEALLKAVEIDYPCYWSSDLWANQISETPWDSYQYGSTQSAELVERRAASNRGQKRSTVVRANISLGKIGKPAHNKGKPSKIKGIAHPQVACPHCNKTGGRSAMPRWHFNNCKFKENYSYVS
jgi:hypothetical protein